MVSNGASALLHLVRASIEHDLADDTMGFAYSMNTEDITESPNPLEPTSALSVLLHKENRHLILCNIDGDEVKEKRLRDPDSGSNIPGTNKMYHTFQDRVEQLYESLEKMIDYEIDSNSQNGVKINFRARRYVEGWDFKDLVTDNDPFYPRVSTLQDWQRLGGFYAEYPRYHIVR